MAKFLNTRKAVSEIEDLIRNANDRLILISPYLKLSKDFKELLTFRNKKDKITNIIFGKQELNPEEMKFLQSLRFVILMYNENLHAKCYLNDDKIIITSLNLYEFSMANNKEMGVLVDKNDPNDNLLFEETLKEVDYIKETSQRFQLEGEAPNTSFLARKSADNFNSKPGNRHSGYCIRTGVPIAFNPEKPLSYEAYKRWEDKGGDPGFPEKFCHFSGEPSHGETCVGRPILKKNWKIARETFNF